MTTAIEQAMADLPSESRRIALQAALDAIADGGREIDAYAAAERNRSGQTSTKSGPVTNLQDQLLRAMKTAKKMGAGEFAHHLEALAMLTELLRSADDIALPPPNMGPIENCDSVEQISPPLLTSPRVVVIRQKAIRALCKTHDPEKAGTIGPTVNLLRRHLPDAHHSQIYTILQELGQNDIELDAVKNLWRQGRRGKSIKLPPS